MQHTSGSTSNSTIHNDADNLQLSQKSIDNAAVKPEQTFVGSDSTFPEGGLAAWDRIADYFVQHYLANESASAISIISRPLYDRGYFYHLIIGGAVLQSFSLFMLSLARPGGYYQIFLALGLGCGLGEGLVYVPRIAVISQYFQKRRTFVITLITTGSSIGSVIHPIMLNNLLNGQVGFANGVRISAAVVATTMLTACLLMRTRIPPPTKKANYVQVAKSAINDSAFMIAGMGLSFQNITMRVLFAIGFRTAWVERAIFILFNWSLFDFKLVILNASSFFGRLSPGPIVKFIEVPNFFTLAAGACTAVIFGMIGLKTLISCMFIGITFEYFAGAYIAMLSPVIASLTPDLSELG
ncbi:hypothetical protein BJ138DRAFT_1098068 [Hygrophoropsis aurantiaca]|uniref:Uncharacterized protein n=1 Tax=Hygrophoropsis aurantiaca TaxID=72124 RepID=A0ACB8AS41_9AGAM|nr:hypothetical protein BJ138DRAFT_1098068 [Hygrophoropsis aurantiaca]